MRAMAGIFGGFILAFLSSQVASLIFRINPATILFLLIWAVGFAIAFKAKSSAKAWRWLLLLSALFAFLLPIAVNSIPRLDPFASSQSGPAEALGYGIGSTLGQGFTRIFGTVCGVVTGVILLGVGLAVGRKKTSEEKETDEAEVVLD